MTNQAHPAPNPAAGAGQLAHGTELQRTAQVFSMVFIGACVSLIVVFFVAGLLGSRDDFVFLAFAILMSFVPIVVGLARQRGYDLFEPINVAAGAIFLGTTLRAFYLVFMPDRFQAKFLMLHQSFGDINRNIIWVLVGIAMFCFGYLVGLGRFRLEKVSLLNSYTVDRARFNKVLIACLLLSLAGVYFYMNFFGINLSSGIIGQSFKRSAEYVSESGEVVYGSGWQTQLSKLAIYGSTALVIALFARIIRPTPYALGLLAALVLAGIFVPFLGQNRTPIILLLFNFLVAASYYGRVKSRTAVIAFLSVAALVSVMGAIRANNSYYVGKSGGFLETTVGSGNGFDSVRSAAIIDRVPEYADFRYGDTYLAVPFFWVPRAIWPNKPQPSLGAWVKTEVFGQWSRLNGWPPGLVADGYINFGFLGIFIVPFAFGCALRMFYETFRPLLGVSYAATVLYVSMLYTIAWNGLDLNLAMVAVLTLNGILPAIAIMVLSGRIRRGRSASRPPGPGRVYPR